MTRISPLRRGAVLLATLVAGLTVAAPAPPVSARPAVPSAPMHGVEARAAATTRLTFKVATCARCKVRLYQAVEGDQDVWESRTKRVRDGRVSFTILTEHTHGLSASVRAPWEGSTGFVTMVAFRYGKESAGSKVRLAEARAKKRASGCWAGTDRSAVTIPLKVRKVTVPGNTGPTPGTIAWTGTTRHWWRPMLPAYRGVLGAQDVIFCTNP